jgi:hypothetical protein
MLLKSTSDPGNGNPARVRRNAFLLLILMGGSEDMYNRNRAFFIVLTGFVSFFSISFPIMAGNTAMDLDFGKQTVSANIRGVPLRGIVERIKSETDVWFKVWIKDKESLLDEPVSVQFKDIPLSKGLERIFSRLNHSLVFDNSGRLLGVILLGKPETTTFRGRRRVMRPRRTPRRFRRR